MLMIHYLILDRQLSGLEITNLPVLAQKWMYSKLQHNDNVRMSCYQCQHLCWKYPNSTKTVKKLTFINPFFFFWVFKISTNFIQFWCNKNFQVYWAGPILGGIAAALLYKHVFQAPSLGPLKIIERYTTVVTDEKEVNTNLCFSLQRIQTLVHKIFY